MRKILVINGNTYVGLGNGMVALVTLTPTVGGMYLSYGEPQSLTDVLGSDVDNFMRDFVQSVIDAAYRGLATGEAQPVPPETEDRALDDADVKGAILLKRLDEGR